MPDHRASAGERLSDDDVQRIAEEIVANAAMPEDPRPADHILSQTRELPPRDEERVDKAVEDILARRASPQSGRGQYVSGLTGPRFTPALHAELSLALDAYASTRGADREDQRLTDAMDRACREAHSEGMTAEAMVIAIRSAYNAVAAGKPAEELRLRGAYDRLIAGCIHAYFEEQQRRRSS